MIAQLITSGYFLLIEMTRIMEDKIPLIQMHFSLLNAKDHST